MIETTLNKGIKTIEVKHQTQKMFIPVFKIRKDYIVYLKKKSVPNRRNIDLTKYKIGYKAAEVIGTNVVIYERTNKTKTGEYWKEVGKFNPTQIEVSPGRIYYWVQKYLHLNIFKEKESVTFEYENGTKDLFSFGSFVQTIENIIAPEKQSEVIEYPF